MHFPFVDEEKKHELLNVRFQNDEQKKNFAWKFAQHIERDTNKVKRKRKPDSKGNRIKMIKLADENPLSA